VRESPKTLDFVLFQESTLEELSLHPVQRQSLHVQEVFYYRNGCLFDSVLQQHFFGHLDSKHNVHIGSKTYGLGWLDETLPKNPC